MKLYTAPGTCSLATNILLRETGLKFDIEKVSTKDHRTASGEDFYAINPKGYVPALRLDDGDILTENVVLHGYVADLAPQAKLAPAHGTKERLKLDELSVYISTELHKQYSLLFSSYPEDVKAQVRNKLLKRYELIEQQLGDGRSYLMGKDFQTADAYLFTISGWAPKTGVDLSVFPRLNEYLKRVAERPAVKAALESDRAKAA